MKTINYTETTNLSETMDLVTNNHDVVIIKRPKVPPVILLSVEEYEGLLETCYLLKNPINASRLMDSIHEVENNNSLDKTSIAPHSSIGSMRSQVEDIIQQMAVVTKKPRKIIKKA